MKNELLKATVVVTGKKVEVYRHRLGDYVDFSDCTTMYTAKELRIEAKKAK